MVAETGESLALLAKVAGWLGNACFFSRFFLQWLASERARRSVVPRAFWWLSVCGAALMSTYSLHTGKTVLLLGFLVNGTISARNLWLSARGKSGASDMRWVAVVGLLFAAILFVAERNSKHLELDEPFPWLWIVGLGQALWVTRFPIQWWMSERKGESHFPTVFWWQSLVGNLLLLAYALHLGDAVYILGFLPGPLVQTRNLWLGRRGATA